MFFRCQVELLSLADLGDDRFVELLLSIGKRGCDDRFVFIIVIEDRGGVLRAFVVPLLILGGGVVRGPEPCQGVAQGKFVGVINHANDFNMTGLFPADLFVCGVRNVTTGEAGNNRVNSFQLLENGFHTPVASSAKGDRLKAFGDSFFIIDAGFQLHVGWWGGSLGFGFAGGDGEKGESRQKLGKNCFHCSTDEKLRHIFRRESDFLSWKGELELNLLEPVVVIAKGSGMETRVLLPEGEAPATIKEVVLALQAQKLSVRHDKKNWGDWLVFEAAETVVSIESNRGLTSSATIEEAEGEEDLNLAIVAAFRKLGWEGEDEDGRYPL